MGELQELYSAEEIQAAVLRLAAEVRKDYQGKAPLLVGVLKGCFVFMADLVRQLDLPLEIEFIQLSSYGSGRTESSGHAELLQGLRTPIKGRHVLIVEDIVDTGISLRQTLEYLWEREPASLNVCVLFDKPERREVEVPLDYVGLTVPNMFVVGYGLDCDEKYRGLPGLHTLTDP